MADEVKTEEVIEKGPVKGTLLTPEQAGEWGNETVMVEKKAKTEANALDVEEPDKKEEPKVEVKDEITVDEPEEPEEVIEDPGQYVPQDYSFEVTVFDADGKKPKTVVVDSIRDWETLLADEPNLGNSLAVNKAFRAAQKMESSLENDEKEFASKKAEYDKALEAQNKSQATTQTWANEISYLEENGSLPKVDAKFKNVAWSGPDADKDALADDAVKAQIELLDYMRKENTKRRKLGLSDLGPEAAFNSRLRDSGEKKAVADKKKSGEARKEAGAKIAGSSPNPVTVAPKGIAVGVGGSLRDLGNTSWQ